MDCVLPRPWRSTCLLANSNLMSTIICPLCRHPLERGAKVWQCAKGHSFDVAKEGYVNLLPVQHKNSRDPGDDAQMVLARREFLQGEHYQPLRKAMLELLAPLQARSLLDIGCGEGYYTSALSEITSEVIGLDISRPAIRLAAKRFPQVTWLIGSGALLPIADASVDVVGNIFTQMHVREMQRVLKPAGHVLVVTPATGHLLGIREQLFEEVRPYDATKFLSDFEADFSLEARQEISFSLTLDQRELRQLLQMTPYVWRAKQERRVALEARETFTTEAAFTLMLMQKRPA